jgi:hypothetical protein
VPGKLSNISKPQRLKAPRAPQLPSGIKKFRTPRLKPPAGLKSFPGARPNAADDRDDELGPVDPSIVAVIERALKARLQIGATYWGEDGESYRTFLPLALGSLNGHLRLWSYQLSGDSGTGLRCFRVSGLKNAQTQDGAWPTISVDPVSEKCMNVEEGVLLVRSV